MPAGLEGNYQIDLTATDTLGNRNDERIDWNHWQGEIDTAPPRISIAVQLQRRWQHGPDHLHRLR